VKIRTEGHRSCPSTCIRATSSRPDCLSSEAAAAVFGEKQLADLTIAIGLMNAYNRIAISFRATPMALAA
jgi:alkylhydroperoxidase family enzyme